MFISMKSWIVNHVGLQRWYVTHLKQQPMLYWPKYLELYWFYWSQYLKAMLEISTTHTFYADFTHFINWRYISVDPAWYDSTDIGIWGLWLSLVKLVPYAQPKNQGSSRQYVRIFEMLVLYLPLRCCMSHNWAVPQPLVDCFYFLARRYRWSVLNQPVESLLTSHAGFCSGFSR